MANMVQLLCPRAFFLLLLILVTVVDGANHQMSRHRPSKMAKVRRRYGADPQRQHLSLLRRERGAAASSARDDVTDDDERRDEEASGAGILSQTASRDEGSAPGSSAGAGFSAVAGPGAATPASMLSGPETDDTKCYMGHDGVYMGGEYDRLKQPLRATQDECTQACKEDVSCVAVSWPSGKDPSSTHDCFPKSSWNAAVAIKHSGWNTLQVRSCQSTWTLLRDKTSCSPALRKDLATEGTSLAKCKKLARADAECGDQLIGNGDVCSCVRAGQTCDMEGSSKGNKLYQLIPAPTRRRRGTPLEIAMPPAKSQNGAQKKELKKLLSPKVNKLAGKWQSSSGSSILIFEDVLTYLGDSWKMKSEKTNSKDVQTYSLVGGPQVFGDSCLPDPTVGCCHLKTPKWYQNWQKPYLACGVDTYRKVDDLAAMMRTTDSAVPPPPPRPCSTGSDAIKAPSIYELGAGAAEADVITAPAAIWNFGFVGGST